jgi:hypothetical protein
MEITQFFDAQLHSTLEGFTWAAQQIPADRLRVIPPGDLGEWSATQHIFHLLHYEHKLALPSMHQWLGGPAPIREEVNVEIWESPPPLEDMLEQFREVRLAEIALLPQFDASLWHSTRSTTFWGEVSLFWVVSKTFHHCLDHTQELMRLSLFWDRVLARINGTRPATRPSGTAGRGAPSG